MPGTRVRHLALTSLTVLIVACALAAVAPLFAGAYWALELPGHLRAHLAVGIAVITVVYAALGAWQHASLGAVLALLVAAPVISLWLPASTSPSAGVALRVLSLNVSYYDRNYDEVVAVIRSLEPDVVGLVEVNARWIGELSPLDREYPHRVHHAPPRFNAGVALLSHLAVYTELGFRYP